MIVGSRAPKVSSFRGIVNAESIFGTRSLFNYHDRNDATVDSNRVSGETLFEIKTAKKDSFVGYTSRSNAVENSTKENKYFTTSSSGRLYTEEDRQRFADENRIYLETKGKPIWEFMVSVDSYEFARDHNCQMQDQWSIIAEEVMPKICKALGLEMQNVVYWQDFHTNTDNPHSHLTFFEKKMTRRRGMISENKEKYIKAMIVNAIVGRDKFTEKNGMTVEQYLKSTKKEAKENLVRHIKKFDYRTSDKLLSLYVKLPAVGRLQYNSYQMKPFKDEMDDCIKLLLESDGVKKSYDEFIKVLDRLEEIPNGIIQGNIATIKDSEIKKLYEVTGNYFLNVYKKMENKKEFKEILRLKEFKASADRDLLDSLLQKISTDEKLNEEDARFVKAAVAIVDGRDEKAVADAQVIIKEMAMNGHGAARRFYNRYKKSLGLNKRSAAIMNRNARALVRGIKQIVRDRRIELNDEIKEYLADNSDVIKEPIRKKVTKEIEGYAN